MTTSDSNGSGSRKPRIAVFNGGTATITNNEPYVTSNKAREQYGLPLLQDEHGEALKWDVLRAQRLAVPVTVYVEQFSAHPLERDAAELYGLPDGYVDKDGAFHPERTSPNDKPVYQVILRPEDGLYPLPYMARQADGRPWDSDCAEPNAPGERCRQPFFPDGSRLFEEIDRFGIGAKGTGSHLSSLAAYDFYRAAPSSGYRKGLAAALRTDVGDGDIPPEVHTRDFFPYRPRHLGRGGPPLFQLANLTNCVQEALDTGQYAGAVWLEGTPHVEETTYWLNVMVDTALPIVGTASQRPHGSLGNDGDHNIVDAVEYIVSRVWADDMGQDRVGVVVVADEVVYMAREVQKFDARPGGYIATGGHGGIVGRVREGGGPVLTFLPTRKHTYQSAVSLRRLPNVVDAARLVDGQIALVPVQVKDAAGRLNSDAMPKVTFVKHARYHQESMMPDPDREVDIIARLNRGLRDEPLAGFVAEGSAPYGNMSDQADLALARAIYSGLPVVKVGRGNADAFAQYSPNSPTINGNNLSATKARMLLMACLLRFGSLPPAADPANPTEEERAATLAKVADYQAVFATH